MAPDPRLYPTLAAEHTIEVGDFIRARSMTIVTGFVTGMGHLGRWQGKPWVPSYAISDWHGKPSLISVDDAELIHKSDDWWERATPEYQEMGAMSLFVKVGGDFINLAHVRKIVAWTDGVSIDLGDDVITVIGAEAVALADYLNRSTSDVVAVYQLHQAELARLAAEAATETPTRETPKKGRRKTTD